MVSSVQHTIKIKFYSGIKCTSQSQQMNLCKFKKKGRLNKVYDSYGETGPFCDMEDLEILKFYMSTLYLISLPLMLAKISMVMKVMNLLLEEGTGQILNLVT